jgi:hypothetical protein
MSIHPTITVSRVLRVLEDSEYPGFCLHCGAEASGVEPDARQYTCEVCGVAEVYGAEEIVLSGAFHQNGDSEGQDA